MTLSDRKYTALMLLAVGVIVAVILRALEMSTTLVVGVVVAFAVAAAMAFAARRHSAH